MIVDPKLKPADLLPAIARVFELACRKVRAIDRKWDPGSGKGAPVLTVNGRYTTRGWTEWTQGFQYGCAILAFDGTDDRDLLDLGRKRTIEHMTPHLTNIGVHDHGFNTISTYANLRRLMREGRFDYNEWEMRFYELAIKVSGAVQATRWVELPPGLGYVYSFNGRHSLFIDTMRTLRVLDLAHQLGHVLMGQNDRRISLLERAVTHALTSAAHNVYYGEGRDDYDGPEQCGRTAHEAIFNAADGSFRCPGTQQGYSPFTTWTRGLAWAMLGFAEQLEFLHAFNARALKAACGLAKSAIADAFQTTAAATCDYYLTRAAAADGIPYWDDGAPGLAQLGAWRDKPADPFNEHEPVDSSAAAIAAQGLLRLGHRLGRTSRGKRYTQAGLTIARTLFDEPYLSTSRRHQGLLLHTVYHRPRGWDQIPRGRKVPCGESSMWGDYHLLELAVYIQRLARGGPYLTFFDA